jgi:hypothetical protein
MACTVETTSIASLRFGAAAFIIATVMSSTLAADRAASSEPTPPMMYREGSSAAYPFAEFVAEDSAVMHAASVTSGARDQHPESMPNDGANISRPHEIDDTSASWRQIGGSSCGAGSQQAGRDFIAV